MTQEEQSKIAKINTAADKFITAKGEIKQVLNEYGVSVTDQTPFADYPDKVEELGKRAIPEGNESIVLVNLNAPGSGYWIPETQAERDKLLEGAFVQIDISGAEAPITKKINKLEDETVAFHFNLPASEHGTISFHFGTAQALCVRQSVHIVVGSRVELSAATYKNTIKERIAFGRAQVFIPSDTSTPSEAQINTYSIKRVYQQDGSYEDYIGYFNDDKGEYVSQTGIKLRLQNGGDDLDAPIEDVWIENKDDNGAVLLEQVFRCFRDIRIVDVMCGVNQKMVRFPKVYTKRERTTLKIKHWSNNSYVSEDSIDAIVLWIADEKIDDSWHLHGAFVRSVRGEADVELDEIFISRYKVNSSYNSVTGVDAIGTTRANYASNIKAKNGTQVTYVDDYGITRTFAANADTRRWAMIGYREQSLLTLYAYLWFGTNTQQGLHGTDGLMGITTSENPDPGQPKTGSTDHLVAKGIMIGGNLNTDNRKPTIFLGIENPFSSSEGTMMGDVTSVAYRAGEGNTEEVNTLMLALDRADYNPGSDAYDTLLSSGYHEIQVEYPESAPDWSAGNSYEVGDFVTYKGLQYRCLTANSDSAWTASKWYSLKLKLHANNRMANLTAKVERDLYFPTAIKSDENITACNKDTHWANSAPASGIATKNFKMVALGTYRNYRLGLGAFCLNAYNALSYSSGDYWRSRSSLQLV